MRAAALAAALGLLAAGCGDSGSEVTTTTTTVDPVECDAEAIRAAVEAAVAEQDPNANVDPPYDVGCADGWAYARAEVLMGDQQVEVTFVFELAGGEWVPQDREAACAATRVPEEISERACAAG